VASSRPIATDNIPQPKPRRPKFFWLFVTIAAFTLMGLGAIFELLR
jgi:hypothetical protein